MGTPRLLGELDARRTPRLDCDVLVVGSGVAGCSAAVAAAERGAHVILLAKAGLGEGNTVHAQGGIAAAMSDEDDWRAHASDTETVGVGLCDPEVVRQVVKAGPDAISRLVDWGASFDRRGNGLELSREAGHSRSRIIHAHGDGTGREVQESLARQVRGHAAIDIHEETFVRDLLTVGGAVLGVLAFDKSLRPVLFVAGKVILATGGAGQLFRETTNPTVATGDGVSLAYRAGAVVRDLEFVQFHPTTLYIAGASRVLISEVVRGAGAVLRDRSGDRFMVRNHPDAELAPRDVVSRSILRRMVETGDTHVYLDLSAVKGDVRTMFPGIARICAGFGIDIARDPIPVRPGAHYMVGGVKTDRFGRTSVTNLLACGEVASSGLHGANRLASNSLLEGLVIGHAAGTIAVEELTARSSRVAIEAVRVAPGEDPGLHLDDMLYSLKALMWLRVGVERSEAPLVEARTRLEFWRRCFFRVPLAHPRSWELANMLIVATLIVESALTRRESRGTHYRTDHPAIDDVHFRKHTEFVIDQDGSPECRS